MELENICKELDELALRYFQVLDDLSERKRQVESLLKGGFLNLSKARYSMGNRAVSTLQYDSTMRALANVDIREEDQTSTFKLNRHQPSPRRVRNKSEHESQGNQHIGDSQTENKVRRRKGKGDKADNEDKPESTVENIRLEEVKGSKGGGGDAEKDDDEEEDRPLVDPLHWFGILVPTALKQGQSSFVKAVDESTRIASLQNQLMSLQDQYKSLYKTKRQLQSEQDDIELSKDQVESLGSNGECNKDKAAMNGIKEWQS